MKETETAYEHDYQQQATDFLELTGTTLEIKFRGVRDHFSDGDLRNVYRFTLKRGHAKYSADYGDSLQNSFPYVFSDGVSQNVKSQWMDDWAKGKKINVECHQFKTGRVKCLKNPTAYDILVCLTKYDPDTFEAFCENFGYDEDSRKAEKIYNAVVQEYLGVLRLWDEKELSILEAIQ